MNKPIFYDAILLLLVGVIALCLWHLKSSDHTVSPVTEIVHPKSASHQQSVSSDDLLSLPKRRISDLSLIEIQTQLETFKNISNEREKARFIALLRHWIESDEQGAFNYANSLGDGKMRRLAITLVADVVAHSDPQFLAQGIQTVNNAQSRTILIRELANVWPKTDVQSALMWAEQLPEGTDKEDALVTIRTQLAAQDPEAASIQVAQLSESDSTSALVSAIAKHWASSDPTKAVAWANTLTGSEKTLAVANLTSAWAQSDPIAAANFVAQLPEGEIQDQAARSVISIWANKNPQEAAAWVIAFPPGDLRNQGIDTVVTDWSMIAPEKAQDWVLGLPPGATQNIALRSFAESVAYSISDPVAQEQSLESIMRSWAKNDPVVAKNWLAGWNAAGDLKTRLQSYLDTN